MERGYEKLDIYKLAKELAVEIHKMSLLLPKWELYEEGSQIRRSAKSVPLEHMPPAYLKDGTSEYEA